LVATHISTVKCVKIIKNNPRMKFSA